MRQPPEVTRPNVPETDLRAKSLRRARYRLETYACGKCRGGVTSAKGPTPVLERTVPTLRWADVVVGSRPSSPAPSHHARSEDRLVEQLEKRS